MTGTEITGVPLVEIDRDACAGHGRCYTLAEHIFEPDDDGFPVIIGAPTDEALLGELRAAERNCPERAVIVGPTA